MILNLLLFFLLLSPSTVIPGNNQAERENCCMRNGERIGLTFAYTIALSLFLARNTPSPCAPSHGEDLTVHNETNMAGYSWDFLLYHCADCSSYGDSCNEPIPGLDTPQQLIEYVDQQVRPICGNKTKINVRKNVYNGPASSEIYSFDKQRIIDICVPKPRKLVEPQWKQPTAIKQRNSTYFQRKFKKNFR